MLTPLDYHGEKMKKEHAPDSIDLLAVVVVFGIILAVASCASREVCREVNIPGEKTKTVCSKDW